MIRILPALTLLGGLLLASCFGGLASEAEYSVKNGTDQDLHDVTVSIGDHHGFSLGIMIPGTGKSFGGGIRLAKDNGMTLKWTANDGSKELRSLTVSKAELTDERQIRFTINPDGSVTRAWRFESTP